MASATGNIPTDIRAIVTVPDGSQFVTGADDGSIRLWTTEPQGRVHATRAHQDGTRALALHRAGGETHVFSAGMDNRTLRWQLTPQGFSAETEITAVRADAAVHALAVRAEWIAIAGDDCQVRLTSHEQDRTIVADAGFRVRAVGLSPDGRAVVAAGTRREVGVLRAWRVNQTRLQLLAETEIRGCHTVRCLLVDAGAAVVGGDDGVLRRWFWPKDELVDFDPGHTGPIHALARDGNNAVVSGGSDGSVLKWSLANRTMIERTKLKFPSGVLALAIPVDVKSPMVFAGGGQGEIRVLRDREPVVRPFSGHSAAVRAISVSDNGELVVTGSADKTARMWGSTGKQEKIHLPHADTVSAVAVWPGDDWRIVTGCENGEVVVWDRFNRSKIYGPFHHGAKVWAVAVSPDGDKILSGGNDRTVALWNTRNGQEIKPRWEGAKRAVSAIAISGDGEHVVIGDDDGVVSFRSLRDRTLAPQQAQAVDGQVRSVAIDRSGVLAAVGGEDGRVTLWDVRTATPAHAPIQTGHDDVRKVLLSTMDETVVTCGANGTIERWDYRTGTQVGRVMWELAGVVETIALMPDGRVIVAGGSEGELDLVHTNPRAEESAQAASNDLEPDDGEPHPFLTGDAPTGDDAIDNVRDVRAIAELLAARRTKPPLSLALLGDWGSGKTSMMLQVLNRVGDLAISAERDQESFWARNVRQIRFNAWHYSDDHLWTGLADQLMHGLRLDDTPAPADDLRAERAELIKIRDLLAGPLAESAAPWWRLDRQVRRGYQLSSALVGVLRVQWRDDRLGAARTAFWRRLVRRGLIFAVSLAAVAGLAVLAGVWAPALWSVGVAVIGGIPVVGAAMRQFASAVDQLDTEIRTVQEDATKKIEQATRALNDTDPVSDLRDVLAELTNPSRYEPYRGVTGIVHRDLRRLADALARAQGNSAMATARLPERIILYIDDLDRCPPGRVVEVLQAVNLLMSIPVFIVVVTVDPPSLFRALDAFHATGDERTLRTLALGLLDKVFNIVFAVRPLGERGPEYLTRLIHDIEIDHLHDAAPHVAESNLVVPPDSPRGMPVPGPDTTAPFARVFRLPPPRYTPIGKLRITKGELRLLQALSRHLAGPRAVKKLTNVYRLILAGEHHRRTDFRAGDYQAAAVMAAGLIHAPHEFAALIEHLGDTGPASCDHATNTHLDIVDTLRAATTCRALADVLATCVVDQIAEEPGFTRCAEVYRDWSVKVARYGFETYRYFSPA